MGVLNTNRASYIIAALVGAIGGGLVVVLATQALHKMMSIMMQNLMSNMAECGCDPAEI